MPAWLIPALKAVLPHLGTVVSAAAPVFTKKSAGAATNQMVLLQQQVTELQAAASVNDAHIKELAAQIKSTVEVLEQGAALAERRHRRIFLLNAVAVVFSVAALCAASYVLLAR